MSAAPYLHMNIYMYIHGRASRLECVRRGFESNLSATFSKEKLPQVLCCVVLLCVALSFFLSFSLSERLSIHEHTCRESHNVLLNNFV